MEMESFLERTKIIQVIIKQSLCFLPSLALIHESIALNRENCLIWGQIYRIYISANINIDCHWILGSLI